MGRLDDFIAESFEIEGIAIYDADVQRGAAQEFLALPAVAVADMERLAHRIQQGAALRQHIGFDVRVGNYVPPRGGANVVRALENLLLCANDGSTHPWRVHVQYELLHPFTDGNGRTGRMLWLWVMKNQRGYNLSRLFLHEFYYQTLDAQGWL